MLPSLLRRPATTCAHMNDKAGTVSAKIQDRVVWGHSCTSQVLENRIISQNYLADWRWKTRRLHKRRRDFNPRSIDGVHKQRGTTGNGILPFLVTETTQIFRYFIDTLHVGRKFKFLPTRLTQSCTEHIMRSIGTGHVVYSVYIAHGRRRPGRLVRPVLTSLCVQTTAPPLCHGEHPHT